MPTVLTNDNFEKEVINSKKPVLVDFWATWCMPCKMLAPAIDALETDFTDKAVFAKLDVDENKEIASRYGIMSIPTVLLFKNGEIVEQFVGVQPKATYTGALNKYI
ncbi:MAG: thioredoxin [Deferribacteraceae bacterium]|jgi:thioredoxin 1|nr:thioredoxin [Deferribacteraceae bacterium]